MRIGIDARLIEETGVGRYIRNLIKELALSDQGNEYFVFLRKKSFDVFRLPNARWKKVLADVPWHSFVEQLIMPGVFRKARLDLLHVPYFNIPLFYPGRFIVTIHDLTILHFDTGKASTLPWVFYKMRRLGYRLILWVGLRRAQKILAVSQSTKNDIVKSMRIDPSKIAVTYEGVDTQFRIENSEFRKKRVIPDEYFLYVGNAYPHKNLETLLTAFKLLITDYGLPGTPKLVLVGKDDFFYRRLRQTVKDLGLSRSVVFFGPANDTQLVNLYTFARALVFSSLMEGFGLPALEATALGCPVLCSDIPVFHEILGQSAVYFNPRDPEDIRVKLESEISKTKTSWDKRFSWKIMAAQTRKLYESSARL